MSSKTPRVRSPETVAAVARLVGAIISSPRLKRFEESWDRAIGGDYEALIEVVDDSGIEVLNDEDIKRRIYMLDPNDSKDRRFLERIVTGLRRYLLTPRKPGRRPQTPVEAIKLPPIVQRAFEKCPVRVKKRYNNPSVRELDAKSISEHVARAVPPNWRESIRKAIPVVLAKKPGIGKSFGIEVVAQSLSRSSRWIRSTQKSKRV